MNQDIGNFSFASSVAPRTIRACKRGAPGEEVPISSSDIAKRDVAELLRGQRTHCSDGWLSLRDCGVVLRSGKPIVEPFKSFFGANSGNAVQMSMQNDRLSQHDSLRPSITDSGMSSRQIAGSGLLQTKLGIDPVEDHHA
jgi:hypothetical protein